MTEKKLWTLNVDEEFKTLIPPLTEDEHRLLEESILKNGCEMPILVWNGTIIDGHNRYDICHAHGIPFATEEKVFESRTEVVLWMLRNQLGRRNLNSFQRSEMALKLKDTVAAISEKRMMAGVKIEDDPGEIFPQGEGKGRTLDKLGRLAGVSGRTLKKVETIIENADEETKNELRKGRKKIQTAYEDVVKKKKADETRICERCHQEKPLSEFTLPSNRAGFSPLCKNCEREVEAAAKAAAKVASETTEPVETYPVQGMAIYNGHPIHIGSVPEDKPEMFGQVLGLLDFAVHGYLADVREAMRWFGPNMRTPENVEKVEALIMNTCESALKMLHDETNMTSENEEG